MKARYKFTQTVMTGMNRATPVYVKHDYVDPAGLSAAAREANYRQQNPGRGLTRRQLANISRRIRQQVSRGIQPLAAS